MNYQFQTDVPQTFSGKFLRFTIKKTVGSTASTAQSFQLSELMVFNTLGRNVVKGIAEAANNTAAANLAPGSFTCPANYYNANRTEGPPFLFDDKVSTKICCGSPDDTVSKYCYFTIRLPDDVTSVNGYMFVTANDSLGRSPSDWMVEGSVDGETWTTLDERTGVAQPYCLFTAMNAGRPFTFTALLSLHRDERGASVHVHVLGGGAGTRDPAGGERGDGRCGCDAEPQRRECDD